jgi:purine catabolism regulator
VTTVGARGEDWGRLYLVCEEPPAPVDTVLIERAATTLALGRLLARQAESLERQAHRTLLSGLLSGLAAGELPGGHGDVSEAEARARALGVPVNDRQLVAAVIRIPDAGPGISAHGTVLAVAEAAAEACRAAGAPALVGSLDDVRAGVLLSLPLDADADKVLAALSARLAERVGERPGERAGERPGERPGERAGEPGRLGHVIGAGSAVDTLRAVRQSFVDAREVADVAFRHPEGRPFYRLPDLRLRGLLHLLRDDPRVQAFTERELGPLLARPGGLLDVLTAYLETGGNKAEAAQRVHLTRPTFYQRLRHIERLLGTDLDSPESRTSLHVALLARG